MTQTAQAKVEDGADPMGISTADISLIGRFGRTVAQTQNMRSVVAEALKIAGKLASATELRIVHSSAGKWKEWHASGSRIREYKHTEWPPPSPAAQTVRLDDGTEQYGFVSISSGSEDTRWVLELLTPHIAGTLTVHAAVRRARKSRILEMELVGRSLRARDEERRRITHELHDDLGQTIAILKVKLKLVENRLRGNSAAAEASEELAEARENVGLLLERIRDLSHTLYPRILDTLGLVPALRELADQVSGSSDVQVRCSVRGKPQPMDEPTSVALYRCCQEGISNSIKHSGASDVAVRVYFSDDQVRLVVEDDGRGFDPRRFYDSSGKLMSSGFWSIRQRMSGVNGSFRISTASDLGTTIEMAIPLPRKSDENDERKDTAIGR